jgi:hypothetical protein
MARLRPSPRPSQKLQEDRATPSAPPRPKANKNDEKQQDGTMPPPLKPKKNDKKQQDRDVSVPTIDADGRALPCRNEMDARLAQSLGAEIDKNCAQKSKAKKGVNGVKKVNGAHEPKLMLKFRNTKSSSSSSSSSSSGQYVEQFKKRIILLEIRVWIRRKEKAGEGEGSEASFSGIVFPHTLYERNEAQNGDDTEDAENSEAEENLDRDSASALVLLSRAMETDEEVMDAARILMKMSGISEI